MAGGVTINAVGDIWYGDHPVCLGHGIASTAIRRGYHHFFANVADHFQGSDFNICNLEGVLSDSGLAPGKLESREMRGSPKAIDSLKSIFNIASVANNHIMQHGLDAYHDTINLLRANEVDVIGLDIGSNKTRVVRNELNGIDLCFAGFSLRPEQYYDKKPLYSQRSSAALLKEEVVSIRQTLPNECIFIVSLHWGDEFMTFPSDWQVNTARQLVDSGVDILLGHHPHVVQGVEKHGNGLICYSLGNFLFDLWPAETKNSVTLKIHIQENREISYEIIPVVIGQDYQLYFPQGHESERLNQVYNKRCHELKDPSQIPDQVYQQLAMKAEKDLRYSSYRYFLKKMLTLNYSISTICQSIFRTVLRRLSGS